MTDWLRCLGAEFLMFPVFTPTFQLSFPTYLARWFCRRFPPEQVEVFNLLPVWAAHCWAEDSNCSSTVIELSVGPSQLIRVMWSHHRTAWQPALIPLITAAGGGPEQEDSGGRAGFDLDWWEDVLSWPCGYCRSNQPPMADQGHRNTTSTYLSYFQME